MQDAVQRELRQFIRSAPLPEPVARQVDRLVTHKDGYREHVQGLIGDEGVFVAGHGYNALLSKAHQLPPDVLESKLWRLASKGLYASGHLWLALSDAIQARGDHAGSVQASTVSKLLLFAAIRSAAGTEPDPYLTPVVGDQYELLNLAGRPSVERATAQRGRRVFDVHRCAGGSEAWFDVTALVAFHERLREQR